jgi:hypothetical protein
MIFLKGYLMSRIFLNTTKVFAIATAFSVIFCLISPNPADGMMGAYFEIGIPEYDDNSEIVDIIEWSDFKDSNTGLAFKLYLQAHEAPEEAGIGRVFMRLEVPRQNKIQGRDSMIIESFSIHSGSNGNPTYPLQSIKRGWSLQQSVAMNDCETHLELQVYVNSHHPFVNYSGSATMDLKFSKNMNGKWYIRIKIYTPRKPITLEGEFKTGALLVTTCE